MPSDTGAYVSATPPLYGIDQTKGPIDADLIEARAALVKQLADIQDGGCPEFARQIKARLDRLDEETRGILAERMAAHA